MFLYTLQENFQEDGEKLNDHGQQSWTKLVFDIRGSILH